MSFAARMHQIKAGFARPFWVANVTELFERLSYYATFAVLARYLHENLKFSVEKAGTLTGQFGGWVWILAIFGGALADRLGFRRALSLAYLILGSAYFLLGSLSSSWLGFARGRMPLPALVTIILLLPALGVALVKPSVVGTTARASTENVRSIGYSIYYTLVNIGGAAGPYMASWVQRHSPVESVFRTAALSVFLMLFVVLFLFKEPKRSDEVKAATLTEVAGNFLTVISNRRFMVFLLIFSGYWIVYWQEFIILPVYVHDYINQKTDTALMLTTGPLVVISLTVVINLLTQKAKALKAVIWGTLLSTLAWVLLMVHPSVLIAYLTLVVVALGEITQSPKYYEYISRLAPPGQQGTYMGFAFLPIGIGSFIGGPLGGWLVHYFGEVKGQPARIWWAVTAIGLLTALLLWIYDRAVMPAEARAQQAVP